MSDDCESPLLEPSDVSRMRTVAISIVVSLVISASLMGTMMYLVAPEYGVVGAYGTGAFVGFWTAPLTGGVAGNGIHEHRLAKLEAADETATETEGPPLHGAA